MAQQIRVSKSGINVLTATNPNDFIFHSNYNTFKILSTGTLLNQNVSGSTSIQLTHGITGIPIVFAFIKFPDGNIHLPGSFRPSVTTKGSFKQSWHVEVDSTKVYFQCEEDGGNYNVDIRYYIFEPTI